MPSRSQNQSRSKSNNGNRSSSKAKRQTKESNASRSNSQEGSKITVGSSATQVTPESSPSNQDALSPVKLPDDKQIQNVLTTTVKTTFVSEQENVQNPSNDDFGRIPQAVSDKNTVPNSVEIEAQTQIPIPRGNVDVSQVVSSTNSSVVQNATNTVNSPKVLPETSGTNANQSSPVTSSAPNVRPNTSTTSNNVSSFPSNQTTTVKRSQSPNQQTSVIKTLSELSDYVDSDCFVQLVEREKLRTKEKKPYYKVVFRDNKKSVQMSIWNDAPLFLECENKWRPGAFYKIRATIHDTNYGPKLEIKRIREVTPADEADGFHPNKCRPSSETSPETLASEILSLANDALGKTPFLRLVQRIFKEYRLNLYEAYASRSHHRNYVGGLLEHTLSVTRLSILLADHFLVGNPSLRKSFSKPLLVAGSILHDVGKILDSVTTPAGSKHTKAGNLIGHAILGVEIIQRFAHEVGLDRETCVRLEHLILTHSRFPEWGAPMPPSTLEAMILHYADYADSTFVSTLELLNSDDSNDEFTFRKGPLGAQVLKPTNI